MLRELLGGVLAIAVLTGSATAQLPRVGSIDFYGLRTLRPAYLYNAIGVQIGDSLTNSREAARATIRERLLQVAGVADADVSMVCCDAGRSLMYVGIREVGSPALVLDSVPAGSERLPDEMIAAEREYLRAGMDAVQERFLSFAAQHETLLRAVLRNSGDAHHRAVAAQILAYVADKKSVVADLVRATRDPTADVRNNAMRALGIMAAADIDVPLEPFIDLLSSVDWTDRNKASFVLAAITSDRDPARLRLLRERALGSLVEMARWRFIGHAAPAGIILGRMAGIPEDQIFAKLVQNREEVIAGAMK